MPTCLCSFIFIDYEYERVSESERAEEWMGGKGELGVELNTSHVCVYISLQIFPPFIDDLQC